MTRVSVRQLANRIGIDPRTVRGIAIGLGLRYERTPAADLFSERDARKIERAYKSRAAVAVAAAS